MIDHEMDAAEGGPGLARLAVVGVLVTLVFEAILAAVVGAACWLWRIL